jgi:hypothetical protein
MPGYAKMEENACNVPHRTLYRRPALRTVPERRVSGDVHHSGTTEAIGRVPLWEKRLTALFQFGEHQFGNFAQGFKNSLACDGDTLSHRFALHLELLG